MIKDKTRAQEMLHLRKEDFLSLREIGEKYGISRERVRQIIGNNSLDEWVTPFMRYFKFHPDTSQYTNTELARELNCNVATVNKYRRGQIHLCESERINTSLKWVGWASNKLFELGMPNRIMFFHSPYQLHAYNNAKIIVCVAATPRSAPSLRNTSPQWGFSVRANERKADFFFLVIAPYEAVFIIPYDKIHNTERVAFCYPTLRPTLFKWGAYQDAYHLIKEFG